MDRNRFAVSGPGRARRARLRRGPTVEALEERSLLSTAPIHHHGVHAHPALSHMMVHKARSPALTNPTAVPGAIPAAAAAPLQVWWSFPSNGQPLGGGPGFLALGFNQPINPFTANGGTVQLAHQRTDGGYDVLATTVSVNPATNAVIIAPQVDQPSGPYVIAVYPGLQSTSGSSLGGVYYTGFTINEPYNPPGGPSSVTVMAPAPGQVYSNSNPFPGVIIADQLKALDPATVNANTVQLHHVNADGSLGATVATTVHYDPEIPSIEVAVIQALTKGTYQFRINGAHDQAGNAMAQPFTSSFALTEDQQPVGPRTLNFPIAVVGTYPANNQTTSLTAIATAFFNQAADPATVNTDTVQLVRWDPRINYWTPPLPITVSYNPDLYVAYIISEQGLPEGNYLIAVNGVKDLQGRSLSNGPYYSHYQRVDPNVPPVDGRTFSPYPGDGSNVNGVPAALLVFLHKFAGEAASSINTNTVQVRPWLGSAMGNPLPVSVTYNPWPGVIVITPQLALGDGVYVISVNGIVDVAGNNQRIGFSSWFTISGTGRPQTRV